MKVALDTNAYSDFLRGAPDRVVVVRKARRIYLPLFVLGELRAKRVMQQLLTLANPQSPPLSIPLTSRGSGQWVNIARNPLRLEAFAGAHHQSQGNKNQTPRSPAHPLTTPEKRHGTVPLTALRIENGLGGVGNEKGAHIPGGAGNPHVSRDSSSIPTENLNRANSRIAARTDPGNRRGFE
jgi:hypothetical protein